MSAETDNFVARSLYPHRHAIELSCGMMIDFELNLFFASVTSSDSLPAPPFHLTRHHYIRRAILSPSNIRHTIIYYYSANLIPEINVNKPAVKCA